MTTAVARLRAVLIWAVLATSHAQADSATINQLVTAAAAALHDGQPQQALALLRQSENQYAGDPDFDFWLGLAAIRAGEPAAGSFALERVIAESPEHEAAYLELASAYVQLRQFEAAEDMLAALERLEPADALRPRIKEIRSALDSRQQSPKPVRSYLSAGVGHDDNAGSWPEGLDILPGIPISAVDSLYQEVRVGTGYQRQSGEDAFHVGAQAQLRQHDKQDAEQFDQRFLALKGQWDRDLDGIHKLQLQADISELALDGEHYYFQSGVAVGWQRMTGASRTQEYGLQVRHYGFDLSLYDYVVTGLYSRGAGDQQADWVFIWRLAADLESALDDRPGGDAWIVGLDASLIRRLSARQRAGLDVTFGHARYLEDYKPFEAINNTSAEARQDDRFTTSLYWDWLPGLHWQIRTMVTYRQQFSSLDAFEYDQTSGGLDITYHF